MRLSRRTLARFSVVAALIALTATLAARWAVPRWLVDRFEELLAVEVEIGDWWLGWSTIGLENVALRLPNGEEWAFARRITLDLSWSQLLFGDREAQTLSLEGARMPLDFDETGRLLTRVPWRPEAHKIPITVTFRSARSEDLELTLRQAGREPVVLRPIRFTADREHDDWRYIAECESDEWGRWSVDGRWRPPGRLASLNARFENLPTDGAAERRLPFAPLETWDVVDLSGRARGAVNLSLDADRDHLPFRYEVIVELDSVPSARFKPLDLDLEPTRGQVVARDGVMEFRGAQCRAMGGAAALGGSIDFLAEPNEGDLRLDLLDLDLSLAPESWGTRSVLEKGRFTGDAGLRLRFGADGLDLAGSRAQGVLSAISLEGLPLRGLRVALAADTRREWFPAPDSAAAAGESGAGPSRRFGPVFAPELIVTGLEIEDVELDRVWAVAKGYGIEPPLSIEGRMSLKGTCRIPVPVGESRDLSRFRLEGGVTLRDGRIAGVPVEWVGSRLQLVDGVLNLPEMKGRVPGAPPEDATSARSASGLAPGMFRTDLRVDLTGREDIALEAELFGVPLPSDRFGGLTGVVSGSLRGRCPMGRVEDPAAWNLVGAFDARDARYHDVTLESVSGRLALREGILRGSDLAVGVAPRAARGGFRWSLRGDSEFEADAEASGWALEDVARLFPGFLPNGLGLDGRLDVRGEARGTLAPFLLRETAGSASVRDLALAGERIGSTPVVWSTATRGDGRQVLDYEVGFGGGRIKGFALLPSRADEPVHGSADVENVDSEALAAWLARAGPGWNARGPLSGKLVFLREPDAPPSLDFDFRLSGEGLSADRVPVANLAGTLQIRPDAIKFVARGDSLRGRVGISGAFPAPGAPAGDAPAAPAEASGRLQGRALRWADLVRARGWDGFPAQFDGLLDVNANWLRRATDPAAVSIGAVAELRGLRAVAAGAGSLGRLRGVVRLGPDGWSVDPIEGELLDGTLSGKASGASDGGDGKFEGALEGFDLARLGALRADAAGWAAGRGNLDLRGSSVGGAPWAGTGFLELPRGRLLALDVSDFEADFNWTANADSGEFAFTAERWNGRLGRGRVSGTAAASYRRAWSVRSEIRMTDLDVRELSRLIKDFRGDAGGLLSGTVKLASAPPPDSDSNPNRGPNVVRGDFVLGLRRAALFELPVFSQLNQTLGLGRVPAFDEGQVVGSFDGNRVLVNAMELRGPVVQMFARGTIQTGGELNLRVIVSTNRIVTEAGQALLGRLPVLGDLARRGTGVVDELIQFFSDRLLKFRVTGTLDRPRVAPDPSLLLDPDATRFFADVFNIPAQLLK